MTLPPLTLVPAGAGSGKTYKIQDQLGTWIEAGLIRPEAIVAVTFTEAAAGELRDRVRARLATKDINNALKLDQAYISTIHGFGLRLITEFAFDAGLSPSPRSLNEDEEQALIRQALAETTKADAVMQDLKRFGYVYDFGKGIAPEQGFRNRVLSLMKTLRDIGRTKKISPIAKHARTVIKNTYGKTRKADDLNRNLDEAVNALLAAFPKNMAYDYGASKAARNDFFRDFRNLRQIQKDGAGAGNWPLWQKLRNMRISNSRCALPEDYDLLAERVMSAADGLVKHPGPLEEALVHSNALFGAAEEALSHYEDLKRQHGLVDFTDMLAIAHDLLVNRDDIAENLRHRIDCLVIDEFQDTNPLQFALLWSLASRGVPALVVGDIKQAIMGFQGADPRLMEAMVKQNPEVLQPLTSNWRTQPNLMDFINPVSQELFGDAYIPLKPEVKPTEQGPLEVIIFDERPPRGVPLNEVRAAHTAARLKALLEDDSQQIRDRYTEKLRRLRGGDIAVLCPWNNHLETYAKVFRNMGLRCQLPETGWHSSRIVEIARYAFTYVANPSDRHAALYLAVTELGNASLQDAFKTLMDGKAPDVPALASLDRISEAVHDRPVDAIIAETIEALDLYGVVATWPDGEAQKADLLRLEEEGRAFVAAKREILGSSGLFGTGIKSFLAWLQAKVDNGGEHDMRPPARANDEDAIQLTTWHKSKGKEWPIVAVASWEAKVEPKLPSIDVQYEDFSSLDKILDFASIEFSPDFAAPETVEAFKDRLWEEKEAEAKRLVYVAITRAREKLILEWPGHRDGKDETTYYSILKDTGLELLGTGLGLNGEEFPCQVMTAGNLFPSDYDPDGDKVTGNLPRIGRRAIKTESYKGPLTEETIPPSSAGYGNDVSVLPHPPVHEPYGKGVIIEDDLEAVEKGSILHRCFEVLLENPERQELIERATGHSVTDTKLDEIEKAVTGFKESLVQQLSCTKIHTEIPILGLNEETSVVPGAIDLIVETEDGFWILDHKTDRGEDFDAGLAHHWPQLKAYGDVAGAGWPEKKLLGLGINWISHGVWSRIEL